MTERASLSGAVIRLALAINVDEVGTPGHHKSVADAVEALWSVTQCLADAGGDFADGLDAMSACLATGVSGWCFEGARPGPNFERLRGLADWALRVVAGSRRQEGGA